MVVTDGVQDSEEVGDAQSVDTREPWEYTDGGPLQRVSRLSEDDARASWEHIDGDPLKRVSRLVEYDDQGRKRDAERRRRRASFTSISRSASKRLSRLLKPGM